MALKRGRLSLRRTGVDSVDFRRAPTRIDLAAYAVARAVVVGVSKALWRLEVEGSERLPAGPFVAAPVHRSNIDTLVVAGITKRRLRYMGKDAVWKVRPVGWLLSALGGFPVHRDVADRDALRRCVDVLQCGEPLVLFPEGGRRQGPEVAALFEGAAFIAARAQVPIVPVGIAGSELALPRGARLPRLSKVRIVIGDPIAPPILNEGGRLPRSTSRELSMELRRRMQDAFDQAKIGTALTA